MRRILVVLSLPILLLLGLFTAATASADTVNGGNLTSGTAVTGAINGPNRNISYTFTATAEVHSTMDVSASNWGSGSAQLRIYLPDGNLGLTCALGSAPSYCEFIPHMTGVWKVVLQPINNATGSTTFTYAADQSKTIPLGSALTTTITNKGQNAVFSYAATAGLPARLNVTASAWGSSGSAHLYFYPPNSTTLFDQCALAAAAKECPFAPNATGNWRIVLDPSGASVGSTTFVGTNDLDKGSLSVGTPVTTAITTAGQNARFSFAGTKNLHTVLDVTATGWGAGGTAKLNVYQADGVLGVVCTITTTPNFCEFTPPMSGTWKVVLDPQGSAVGSVTLTLATDQTKAALTEGTQVVTTIPNKGVSVGYPFTAHANVHSVFDVKASSWGSGGANLNIYQPDGVLGLICPLANSSLLCDFTPPEGGTWKVVIDPNGNSTGSATIVLGSDQNLGTLTAGTPATVKIAARDTTAGYTFTANEGVHTTIDVSATSWGTGGGASLYIYQPDGVLGVICPIAATATFCDFNPPTSGAWKVTVVPTGNSVGSATLTLGYDVNKGSLALNAPATANLTIRGQRQYYTLNVADGENDVVNVTAASWGAGGSGKVNVYLPDGELGVTCPIASSATTCRFNSHSQGQWRVEIAPTGASLGSVAFNVAKFTG